MPRLGQQMLSDGHGSECMGGLQSTWMHVYARAVMGKENFVKEGGGLCGHARLRGMEASLN